MNKLILFALLLCLVAVNARHYGDRENPETLTDEDTQSDFEKEKQHTGQSRHRRRRWQNYGYDYQPPQFYGHRRDSYNNQQEVISDIYRLLEDIATSLKRSQQAPPPPPPQPVYVPYPVPYFVPRYTPCKSELPKVNLTGRLGDVGDVDDPNRIWGFVTNEVPDEVYDDSDGSRPISFDPIKPKQKNLRRPAPSVEHGSVQSKNQLTTQAPVFDEMPPSVGNNMPSMCSAAILTCCSIEDEVEKKKCFTDVGCAKTYSKGDACNSKSLREAFNKIKESYSPVN